jgi:hypothetical protein
MLKKVLILAGIFLFLCACVITSPAEIFSSTPTICVGCAQATICAENQSGDGCDFLTPSSVDDNLPTTSESESTPVDITPTDLDEQSLPSNVASPTSLVYKKTPFALVTLEPTYTLTPSLTPTPEYTLAPTRTGTVDPGTWIYKLQTGSPKYARNFAHAEVGCEWSGIAGQVFGPGGAPQSDVVVMVTGDANGTRVDQMGLTGASVAYGQGAFEVELPDGPVRTYDTIGIQLFDVEGKQLSRFYSFDTYADCTKALVILNFVPIY